MFLCFRVVLYLFIFLNSLSLFNIELEHVSARGEGSLEPLQ